MKSPYTRRAILAPARLADPGTPPGGNKSPRPTIETPTLPATTSDDVRQEDRQVDDDNGAEDVSGPCDEAEHANDPRCTGVGAAADDDDDHAEDNDRHGQNRGPGGGGESGDDSPGHGGGNSGHGGGDDD